MKTPKNFRRIGYGTGSVEFCLGDTRLIAFNDGAIHAFDDEKGEAIDPTPEATNLATQLLRTRAKELGLARPKKCRAMSGRGVDS